MRKIDKGTAIRSLGFKITEKAGGEIVYHEDKTPPTEEAIQAKLAELQADYDAKQYQRDREESYEPIPEQLDQIYHDMDGWKARIKSIKAKFPKPE